MSGTVKSILFATNLSENCRPALEVAIARATQYNAILVLLHVIDTEVPSQVEDHLRFVMGEDKYEELISKHEQDARESLIGKMTSGKLIHRAMRMYREESGIDDAAGGIQFRELVVSDSHIPDAIIAQSQEQGCDLIILGAKKGFMGSNSIGSVIKGVLKKSTVPVTVVPPYQEEVQK